MNGNEFLDKMEYLDADIIESVGESRKTCGSGRTKTARVRWYGRVAAGVAAAACVGIAVMAFRVWPGSGGLPGAASGTEETDSSGGFAKPDGWGDTSGNIAEPGNAAPEAATSDTYANLPELLAYLSGHESHGGRQDGLGGKGNQAGVVREAAGEAEPITVIESSGAAVTTDGRFAYHIGDGQVFISRLDGVNTENVGTIETAADDLFICNDRLILVSQYRSGGNELDAEYSVRVRIYDVSGPENPALLDEYTQRGERTACWMNGATLCLVTGDGVCACGWSRLSDAGGYYPAFAHNGEAIAWGDAQISILGEPTRVSYSAISVINANSREVVAQRALYGDIQRLFYGNGWLAVSVAGATADYRENPVVYTFDDALRFAGKIPVAQTVGAEEKYACEDYVQQAGLYLDINSVTRAGGIYRMIGSGSYCGEDQKKAGFFLTLTADMETGETRAQTLAAEDYPFSAYTEIRWEADRAIACVGVMEDVFTDHMRQETRFLIVEYDGMDAVWYENELTADYLSGRVGVGYGNPFGEFDTLIPLGSGIYLRYTINEENCPGGFDVFDFSDSADPKRLYRAETPICGEDAFDYVWTVYDAHSFGTLKVVLGEEMYCRNVGLAWDVYSVNPAAEMPVTLLEEQNLNLEVRTFMGADAIGFALFDAGGQSYYVTRDRTAAAVLR